MIDGPDEKSASRASAIASQLRVLLGKLRRRLREQSDPGDLTWSQKSALLRLERDGPITITDLASVEGVRPQSMGATICSLEEIGLVYRTPDPADGRKTILSITDDCREWIAAGRAAREDWLFRSIEARLSPAEQEQLAGAIGLLERLVERQEP